MKFPVGTYGRKRLEFFPTPFRAPLRGFAALIFAWQGDQVLLCDIPDRGWCIPSGRVEPGESSQVAAVREANEEAGAILENVLYIGCYRISDKTDVRWADVYTSNVKELIAIPSGFESRGRQFIQVEALPTVYHEWNALIEAVFQYSFEMLTKLRCLARSDEAQL